MSILYKVVDKEREAMDAERPTPPRVYDPRGEDPAERKRPQPPQKKKSYFTRTAMLLAVVVGGVYIYEDDLTVKLGGYLPGNAHGTKHVLKTSAPSKASSGPSTGSSPSTPTASPAEKPPVAPVDDTQATQEMADQAVRAGQFKEAFFGYVRVIQQNPNNVEALTRLVTLTFEATDPKHQNLMLSVMEKNLPQSSAVRALTAATFATRQDFKNAIVWMEKALVLEPGNLVYRQNLAVYYDHTSNWAQAAKAYQDILTALDQGAPAMGIERAQINERLNHILTRLR